MSALHQHLDDYLAIRRALGYQLRQEARMLASFVEHLEAEGLARVTVDAALAWATAPEGASPTWWAKRLTVVRGFATYLVSLDVSSEVPPHRLLANRPSRTTPYLYSEGEILALMDAARRLADPMRAATFEAFIGLMAATGMRTGEAMRVDRDDVDLGDAVMTVQSSKNGKSRLVLLHETTSCALDRYARRRDQLCSAPTVPAFFLSGAGTRLNSTNATTTFVRLLDVAGIAAPPGRRRPRLYDLRPCRGISPSALSQMVVRSTDGAGAGRGRPIRTLR